MHSIENQLESDCLLIAIEGYADEITTGVKLLEEGKALAETISSRLTLTKEAISNDTVNDTVYGMAIESYKNSVEALGYDGPTFDVDEAKPSLEKLEELILSEEGIN